MAYGKLEENDEEFAAYLLREWGLSDKTIKGNDKVVLYLIWDRFCDYLLGQSSENRDFDIATY